MRSSESHSTVSSRMLKHILPVTISHDKIHPRDRTNFFIWQGTEAKTQPESHRKVFVSTKWAVAKKTITIITWILCLNKEINLSKSRQENSFFFSVHFVLSPYRPKSSQNGINILHLDYVLWNWYCNLVTGAVEDNHIQIIL